MRASAVSFFGLALLAASGCHAHVSGDLVVDGTPFVGAQCRSGQALAFSGIELTDTTERRLRLSGNLDGTCQAAVFPPASPVGTNLGTCGVLTVRAQSSRINGITNLEGAATLSCQAGPHAVGGRVQFQNCH
jgi:hypothetical protein